MPSPVRVALLGCGTVGSAVARRLQDRQERYAELLGRSLELVGVAVRDRSLPREGVDPVLLTTDAEALVRQADVVVEVMGGIEPARSLIETALRGGAQVVTANKQLVAQQGEGLAAVAAEQGVGLDYEGAVMAAVPVLAVLRDSLAGDEVTAVRGVVNGSTNYVLDLVAREGVAFGEAVRQAGELGYLEADPTEDLEGLDAAAKAVILARTAFGAQVGLDEVDRVGITGLTDEDFKRAAQEGTVIKLVASARRAGCGAQVAVRPEALPAHDPLAAVRGGTNIVVIEAVSAGELRLQGAGAGGEETASAVLGDIVRAARRVR
ncbi:homoserine dehydrogenase [Ornithinimicrobium pratense]|uniref:homoserine dehydrogenase n=1 Tax=Ornithinimicrobium pratense TaxID=2593973 RepID=UPI00178815FA|nr:homoserine dehydrogenase [Ornithinimicrobium pratense]